MVGAKVIVPVQEALAAKSVQPLAKLTLTVLLEIVPTTGVTATLEPLVMVKVSVSVALALACSAYVAPEVLAVEPSEFLKLKAYVAVPLLEAEFEQEDKNRVNPKQRIKNFATRIQNSNFG